MEGLIPDKLIMVYVYTNEVLFNKPKLGYAERKKVILNTQELVFA
jgi:hypothetical protein